MKLLLPLAVLTLQGCAASVVIPVATAVGGVATAVTRTDTVLLDIVEGWEGRSCKVVTTSPTLPAIN